jgi:outer membrane protein assembly factor BamA
MIRLKTSTFYILLLMLSSLFLSVWSCVPTNKLKEGEYLLFTQSIKGSKRVPYEELESYCKQKPNRKLPAIPAMPYLYAYYVGKKRYDRKLPQWKQELDSFRIANSLLLSVMNKELKSLQENTALKNDYKQFKKDSIKIIHKIQKTRQKSNDRIENMKLRIDEGNWLMRSVGEPPTIYDQSSAYHAADQMQKYLAKNGLFRSEVGVKEDTVGKRMNITYIVKESEPYLIRIYEYKIVDSLVLDIVFNERKNSSIKEGAYYNETSLENERKRITNVLRNKGYFDFNNSYITFEVDSTLGNRRMDITMIIKNPPAEKMHKRYYMSAVVFNGDVDITKQQKKDTTFYNGVTYIQANSHYSKRVLDSKIFLKPNNLYNLSKVESSQSSLAGTDMFKFVNINFERAGADSLKMNIFSSDNDKYQYTLESGVSYTQQTIPGPFASLSWKNRNLFRSADVFELSTRFSIEAQGSVTDVDNNFTSQEYGLNASLSFPRVLVPIPKKIKEKLALLNPKTRFNLGYTLIDRPQFTRGGLQAGVHIQWNNTKNESFNLGISDLTVIHSTLTPEYDSIIDVIDNGTGTYRRTFSNSIISNFNFAYTKSSANYGSINQTNKFLRLYAEIGGLTSTIFKETLLQNQGKIFGLNYYKYIKVETDIRFGIPLTKFSQLATRVHVGMVRPYGNLGNGIDYSKYFFSGGSNSNRAWRPRRVGAGSYTPKLLENGEFDYSLEQPGEFIIESSIEWRTKLFSFFNWAFFVDASNVWILPNSPDPLKREGSTFETKDFWKEFAVGGGFGLRMDFTFLIIRFDVGMKLYDPARAVNDRFIGNNLIKHPPFGKNGQSQLNIGIGYPF